MVTPALPRAETVEMSDDYEIVIPRSVRERVGIRPGQKLQVIFYQGRIEIVPEIDPEKARGSMSGMDITIDRDDDDERI